MKRSIYLVIVALLTFLPRESHADGLVVDKVYHPYVLANERELEWRFMSSQNDSVNRLGQRIGYGHALSDKFTMELYLIGERDQQNDFGLSAYELEGRWMLTEQGQYWADWGMLFELEKKHRVDDWEATAGVLFEKEIGITSLTVNIFIVQEWGETLESEMETEFRMKYRYRYRPEFQPAIELYTGENFFGLGPAFMGVHRIEGQRQLKWELGFISELSQSGKDHTLRFALEYEF